MRSSNVTRNAAVRLLTKSDLGRVDAPDVRSICRTLPALLAIFTKLGGRKLAVSSVEHRG
jgi:hypothetical protein